MVSGPLYFFFISCQGLKSNPDVMNLLHFFQAGIHCLFRKIERVEGRKVSSGLSFSSQSNSSLRSFLLYFFPNVYRLTCSGHSSSKLGEHPAPTASPPLCYTEIEHFFRCPLLFWDSSCLRMHVVEEPLSPETVLESTCHNHLLSWAIKFCSPYCYS